MTKQQNDKMSWCAWCGEWSDTEFMYKNRGDYYHANCVKSSSQMDEEFLFGEKNASLKEDES